MEPEPKLSVVICSIGAPFVAEAVSSVADSAARAGIPTEILVVWQGGDAPPEFHGSASVLDVSPPGLSRARNRGLEHARAAIVAFVDEDEVVDPRWAAGVVTTFEREPVPDAAFGPVAPLDERGLPYCHYEGGEHRLFEGGSTPPWVVGTGGNMAFRRDVLVAAGGFDLRFGIGAPARSAEESDVVIRLLRAGRRIAWSPEMPVYHPTKSEQEHLESRWPYGFGMGSVLRRHRAGGHVLRYLVTIFQTLGLTIRTHDVRRRRETLATFRSFIAGLLTPLRPPADRE
ncbi:MAG: glycosyltransferase [Gaiellaceae bacterium]